jgi:hypothetical protein
VDSSRIATSNGTPKEVGVWSCVNALLQDLTQKLLHGFDYIVSFQNKYGDKQIGSSVMSAEQNRKFRLYLFSIDFQ